MPWWLSTQPSPAPAAPAPAPAPAAKAAGAQPPVVEATVVGVVPVPADLGPQPPPPPPKEQIPNAPSSFPNLDSMSVEELQQLQATAIVREDYILELPQAKALSCRVRELREKNCSLAADVLGREEEYNQAAERLERGRAALKQRLEAVEALSRKREEILKQRSPALMSAALVAKAQDADHGAEELLAEALDSGETMDASALSKFRQRFVQAKMEKHWRLAMKESLERGVPVGTSA